MKTPGKTEIALAYCILSTVFFQVGCKESTPESKKEDNTLPLCLSIENVPIGKEIMAEGKVTHAVFADGYRHILVMPPSGLQIKVTGEATFVNMRADKHNISWDFEAKYRVTGLLCKGEGKTVLDCEPYLQVSKIEKLVNKEHEE